MWAHLVLMVILVLAAVVGLSCAAWHFIRHARAQNRHGKTLLALMTLSKLAAGHITLDQ